MAWTELTRPQYVRTGGRYASDTTDLEWALIAPFLPAPKTPCRKTVIFEFRSSSTQSAQSYRDVKAPRMFVTSVQIRDHTAG